MTYIIAHKSQYRSENNELLPQKLVVQRVEAQRPQGQSGKDKLQAK